MSNPQSSYFLYGYYGAGNFGDDILLYAAIENILARDPLARFLIRNHGAVDFLSVYADRVTLTDIEQIHHRGISAPVRFLMLIRAYWTWMGRASHLVVGGGTLIHDAPYLKSTFLLLCLASIARVRGKKVYGIGLGTKVIATAPGKLIVRLLISSFYRLCLRDEDSFARCQMLTPQAKNLVLTTDLAYALTWDRAAERPSAAGVIAVTLVDYMFENKSNAGLVDTLAGVLSDYARKGHEIRFIALQRRHKIHKTPGDEAILQQVMHKMPAELRDTKCSLIVAEPTPDGVVAAYSGVTLMVGMRFHALIFAAMCGVPFVGLAHEPKIDALAREFDMPFLKLPATDRVTLTAVMEQAFTKTIDSTLLLRYEAMAKENFIFGDKN